jgi:hypothetical protein
MSRDGAIPSLPMARSWSLSLKPFNNLFKPDPAPPTYNSLLDHVPPQPNTSNKDSYYIECDTCRPVNAQAQMRLLKLEENDEFSLTKDITYPATPYVKPILKCH